MPSVFESPTAIILVAIADVDKWNRSWAPVASEREAARRRPTNRLARRRRAIRFGVPVVFPHGYIPGRGTRSSVYPPLVRFITYDFWSENVGPLRFGLFGDSERMRAAL